MKTILAGDPFDPKTYPFGKRAGDNKFDFKTCPTCGKPGTEVPKDDHAHNVAGDFLWFMFRDELSAKEYYISGMCQACQDSVFGK